MVRAVGKKAWDETRGKVEPIFQRLYAGPKARDVYGIEPTEESGLYELEVPLVKPQALLAPGRPSPFSRGAPPASAPSDSTASDSTFHRSAWRAIPAQLSGNPDPRASWPSPRVWVRSSRSP